jgi:excisionase family DNA binding protein
MRETDTTTQVAAAALKTVALPDVCRVEHLAEHLDLTEGAVRKLLREGRLPGRRVGRRWLVARPALLRWLSLPSGPGQRGSSHLQRRRSVRRESQR